MIRRLSMALFALMIAAPLAAQAPDGWQMRLDRSTNAAAADGGGVASPVASAAIGSSSSGVWRLCHHRTTSRTSMLAMR